MAVTSLHASLRDRNGVFPCQVIYAEKREVGENKNMTKRSHSNRTGAIANAVFVFFSVAFLRENGLNNSNPIGNWNSAMGYSLAEQTRMIYGAVMLAAWKNWRERHRHPVSLGLHAVAIPMLVLAGGLIVVQIIVGAWSLWWRPVVLFAISYLLQWTGHAVEGNDMGEVILIKKLLGKPFVAVGNGRQRGNGAARQ